MILDGARRRGPARTVPMVVPLSEFPSVLALEQSPFEVGLVEVGAFEVGLVEVGVFEVGLAEPGGSGPSTSSPSSPQLVVAPP